MKKVYAIIGCIFTVVIAVAGLSGYSAGTHYMTWFGIKLSQGGFLAVVALFVALDIISLKNAFGAEKRTQEMQREAQTRAADAPALEGAPCTVYLTRLPSAAGAAVGVRVFLNGAEQEVLKNGKTIAMQTSLAQNELMVMYTGDVPARTLQFEAEAGGEMRITLKYMGAVLTVCDKDAAPVGPADEKGRYRPLKTGYILWSILNMPIYLLGLVPLIKTLNAAKQPYEDVARRQLRSAKIWNIVLSCILALLILTVRLATKR